MIRKTGNTSVRKADSVSDSQHNSSCGRRVARAATAAGSSAYDAALAVHRHCGVSLLRAHRTAQGYTLVEAVGLLKEILQTDGAGLAHQRLSQWENGLDTPTPRYLDALCRLYRTRPDRLGFGHDYSDHEPSPTPRFEEIVERRHFLSSAAAGAVFLSLPVSTTGQLIGEHSAPSGRKPSAMYLDLLEELTEENGYALYTAPPEEYVPARMIDLARIQACLLSSSAGDAQRRLHRAFAKNAGFIAIRLNDVAGVDDTFEWFGVARRAARRAGDAEVEAWIAGHICDACACYGHSFKPGLTAARLAQSRGNSGQPNAQAVYGYLAEAGVQARMGRRRETLDAVRNADQMFAALPESETVADGLHVTEYFLRWHQSNALTMIGMKDHADPLRTRALELPFSRQDLVGEALLRLDEAALSLGAEQLEEGCRTITDMWDALPAGFRSGQIPRRALQVLDGVPPARSANREVRATRELIETAVGRPNTRDRK
ncbi:helix-turn-helix domain-containing protein [Nocardia sp. NPDC059177]|uniref:helix-turn-helix domain-containing protein n=1 Tax=Nocardia sp. NPDC059177 TaxID=3346759 RepID=UPI0036A8AF41